MGTIIAWNGIVCHNNKDRSGNAERTRRVTMSTAYPQQVVFFAAGDEHPQSLGPQQG
jgi:hypothetical protein